MLVLYLTLMFHLLHLMLVFNFDANVIDGNVASTQLGNVVHLLIQYIMLLLYLKLMVHLVQLLYSLAVLSQLLMSFLSCLGCWYTYELNNHFSCKCRKMF